MTYVLAAVTPDACAQPVLAVSTAVADLLDADVRALHVRERGISAPAELAGAAGIRLEQRTGATIEQIVAAAGQPDVAALVVGSRGCPEGPQPAGHTTLQVITALAKPIVVVPPQAQPRDRLARMLVALEGTADSSRALAAAIWFARRCGLEILVLHVHSAATMPAFADHEPHAGQAWEREFLARHVSPPHERITLLRHVGVPAEQVLAAATASGADLVALAWGQTLGAGRAQVVSSALASASVPVLLLPLS